MKLVIAGILTAHLCLGQQWVQLPDYPGSPRDDGAAAWCYGQVFAGTGAAPAGPAADYYSYNPGLNSWSPAPSLPSGKERQYASIFSDNTGFYLAGGERHGAALDDLYRYDATSYTWTRLPDMPTPVYGAASLRIDDKLLLAGGKTTGGAFSKAVWMFDIVAGTWTRRNDLPVKVFRASATSLHGWGYLCFGIDSAGTCSSNLYYYGLTTDTWHKLSPFPGAGRAYAAMQVLDNDLVIVGGSDSNYTFYNDSWFYSILSQAWGKGPDLPSTARRGGMSCSTGHEVYYVGGLIQGNIRTSEAWVLKGLHSSVAEGKSASQTIYPNPAKDLIWLPGLTGGEITVTVTDIHGTLKLYKKTPDEKLDVSQLKPGLYLLNVQAQNTMFREKIVISPD